MKRQNEKPAFKAQISTPHQQDTPIGQPMVPCGFCQSFRPVHVAHEINVGHCKLPRGVYFDNVCEVEGTFEGTGIAACNEDYVRRVLTHRIMRTTDGCVEGKLKESPHA